MKKHTPGPWAWFQEKYDVYLGTPDRGRLFIMGFTRRGMRGAQPTFSVWEGEDRERLGGIMRKADELDLDKHPDARLIAMSPELLQHLKYMIKLAANLTSSQVVHREEAVALAKGTIEEAETVVKRAMGYEVAEGAV